MCFVFLSQTLSANLFICRKGAENLEEIEHLYNEMDQRIQMEKLAMFNKVWALNKSPSF